MDRTRLERHQGSSDGAVRHTSGGDGAGAALWLQAVRPFSFTASAIPVLLGAAAGHFAGATVRWELLPAVLVAAVAAHAGANLFNDTHDFQRGVDREGTLGGSGLLVSGRLGPEQTGRAAWLALAIAAALGLGFVALRGWPVALVGLVGLAGAYAYTGRPVGYKYVALGDPAVFMLMGPLMVVGTDLVLTGSVHGPALWVSLPVGLLVMSILHANNLRDLDDDRQSGFRTIALLLGARMARRWYAGMVLSAFAIVGALVAAAILPPWSLLVGLALPSAVANIRRVFGAAAGDALGDIDVASAKAHAQFGTLLSVSLVVSSLLA